MDVYVIIERGDTLIRIVVDDLPVGTPEIVDHYLARCRQQAMAALAQLTPEPTPDA